MAGKTGEQGTVMRKVVIDLSIMTVIGIVLALIGPFGSFAEPLAYRLVSWVAFSWVGYAIYRPMGFLVRRASKALNLPKPPLWLFATAIATVPMAIVVWILGNAPGSVRVPSLEMALNHYFYVLVIGGGVTVLFYVLDERSAAANGSANGSGGGAGGGLIFTDPDPASTNDTVPAIGDRLKAAVVDQSGSGLCGHTLPDAPLMENALIARLPAEIGSDIIALEMEDHYVRVYTAFGSDLVLMRLRDAMGHIADIDGLQVHRSWWVARGAVEDVMRDGRNIRLKLAGDVMAPVSRANISVLREAGWI